MTQIRWVLMWALMMCVVVLRPVAAEDIHKIIRPGHVYGLWTQINTEILELADEGFAGAEAASTIRQMPLPDYQDKIPGDVYEAVNAFRVDLQNYAGTSETGQFHDGTLLEDEMLHYLTLDGQTVTPQTVYLRSVFVLEDMTIFVNAQKERAGLLSPYFMAPPAEGKRPGDVFQLVNQAHERLRVLMRAQANAGE